MTGLSTRASQVSNIMSSSEDAVLAAAAVIVLAEGTPEEGRLRRFWMRPSLQRRDRHGEPDIIEDMKLDDVGLSPSQLPTTGSFYNFLRMSATDYEMLLSMITQRISKQDTNKRPAISAATRLALTLRYLATGDSYSSLGYTFHVSKQAISDIIPQVCCALVKELSEHVQVSKSGRDACHSSHISNLINIYLIYSPYIMLLYHKESILALIILLQWNFTFIYQYVPRSIIEYSKGEPFPTHYSVLYFGWIISYGS